MKHFTLTMVAAAASLALCTSTTQAADSAKRLVASPQSPTEIMEGYAKKAQSMMERREAPRMQHAPLRVSETEPEVLLYEDFSLMTAGSEDAPDETMLPEDYFDTGNEILPDGYTHESGWWGLGIYQAGGTCFLGYPSIGGSITTPMMNLNGIIRVSFRMKPGANVTRKASMIITVLKGDIFNPEYVSNDMQYDMVDVAAGDDWTEFSFTYYITYTGDDAYVQFNGMTYDNGKYIDDIKIERLGTFLSAPIANQPTDYTGDSFVASWNEQPATDNYQITAYSYTIPEGDGITLEADYADGRGNDFAYGISAPVQLIEGSSKDYAVALSNGSEMIFDGQGGLLSEVKCRIFSLAETSGVEIGYVYLYYYKDGEWNGGGMIQMSTATEKPSTYLNLFNEAMWLYPNQYEKVKFVPALSDDSYVVYVDDVTVSAGPEFEYDYAAKDIEVVGTTYTVDGMDPYKDYLYYVYAKAGNELSDRSNLVKCYLLQQPQPLEATDVDSRGGFTANWLPVPKAEAYRVSAYNVTIVPEDNDAYPVFSDTFSGAVSEGMTLEAPYQVGNEYESMSLDGLTDISGWTSVNTIYAENMIGCYWDDYYTSQLVSPRFDATHNGGVFTVDFDCYTPEAGDILILQNSAITYEYLYMAQGMNHFSVTFDQGAIDTFLMFYTFYGYPFLIGNVAVTQALEGGAELATLLAQSDWTDDTEYYFPTLRAADGNKLVFNVTARYLRDNSYYYSPVSDNMVVDDKTSALNEVAKSKSALRVEGRAIVACGMEDALVEVYDMAGRKVATGIGRAMVNAPGAYVAVANGERKVVAVK
ncbi:MAG: hypothetical protein LUD17_12440 [Bacteroidales bacterium]|nr:hypothetical protein [Bacteroidales bacterium]